MLLGAWIGRPACLPVQQTLSVHKSNLSSVASTKCVLLSAWIEQTVCRPVLDKTSALLPPQYGAYLDQPPHWACPSNAAYQASSKSGAGYTLMQICMEL